MANEVAVIETRATQLAEKIEALVTEARQKVASVVNTAQVYTYYEIGRYIIEDEQGGKLRAEYGKGVLKRVSERLTERLGKGWSEENLRQMRKFFVIYSGLSAEGNNGISKIPDTVLEIGNEKKQDVVLDSFPDYYVFIQQIQKSLEVAKAKWKTKGRRMRYE